ncbi:MAG: transcription antitermination factor NusB [Peptococcaceae bacterium]|nr:transcription antitermination factor NusB [Peptococcaceae bacterium]
MSRRAAREVALQILYKADIAGRDVDAESEMAYWLKELAADGGERESDVSPLLRLYDESEEGGLAPQGSKNTRNEVLTGKSLEFALALIQGTLARRDGLDEMINETAKEWDLERMDVVDRNLMRLALFEMLFCPDIPQRVSVNEAVELAKIFCGDESAKFVNGILDRFIEEAER